MNLIEVLDFVESNWMVLSAMASAVGVLVVAFVKLTPTKKDDEVVKYLRNFRDRSLDDDPRDF